MKKILASILVLTMLVCCMSISAFAEGAPANLTVEDATATAGETVDIPINVKVTDQFAAVKFTVSTDLPGATISRISMGSWVYDNMANFTPNTANGQTVWANTVNADMATKGEGVIATYVLSIPENAFNGTYTITLECIDFCYVDVNNNDTVTSVRGVTTTDTAVLTVTGGVEPPHEHDFSGNWVTDAENHWKVCPKDDEIGNQAAHVYTDDADESCNVCGYEREIPHEHGDDCFTGEWKTDKDYHWHECAVNGEIDEKVAHEYTDDTDATCNTCGYERVLPHDEHTFGDEWKSDADGHWHECTYGDGATTEKVAHTYTDDADKTCDVCGYERTIDDDDKDNDKDDEDDKKDDTTQTGDNTNLFIYMAICLFAAAAIVVVSYKLKKSRN